MSKKTGIVFVVVGAVLIIAALLLYIHNTIEDEKAGRASADLLAEIKAEINGNNSQKREDDTEFHAEVSDTTVSETEPFDGSAENTSTETPGTNPSGNSSADMPSVKIDDYEFIGYITIPKLGIELPVMSEWSYMKLDMAPCRQVGSVATDDLVIAAHNYTRHFARLNRLGFGDIVIFTDMNGGTVTYSVTDSGVYDGKTVDPVINSGHDLVLYTCTYEGTTRIVIFLDRTENSEP